MTTAMALRASARLQISWPMLREREGMRCGAGRELVGWGGEMRGARAAFDGMVVWAGVVACRPAGWSATLTED
jgi:hypothetical protein